MKTKELKSQQIVLTVRSTDADNVRFMLSDMGNCMLEYGELKHPIQIETLKYVEHRIHTINAPSDKQQKGN